MIPRIICVDSSKPEPKEPYSKLLEYCFILEMVKLHCDSTNSGRINRLKIAEYLRFHSILESPFFSTSETHVFFSLCHFNRISDSGSLYLKWKQSLSPLFVSQFSFRDSIWNMFHLNSTHVKHKRFDLKHLSIELLSNVHVMRLFAHFAIAFIHFNTRFLPFIDFLSLNDHTRKNENSSIFGV